MNGMDRSIIVSGEVLDSQEQPPVESGEEQLLARFLLGVMLVGGEELLSRLRNAQQRIEVEGKLAAGDVIPDDETMTDVLGYLALGMFVHGQKRLARSINRGIHFSINTAGRALGVVNRLADNRLARPFRQPIERRIWGLAMEGQQAIHEGRREAYASRDLAKTTMTETVDEVVQILAENPELTAAIQRVVTGQGASLTGTVVGNARELGVSADDLAEGMVRRVLHRKPRRELPPSPLAGKPQATYRPRNPTQGVEDDGS